jgi:hypothetical protein
VLSPWSSPPRPRPPCAVDRWVGPGWRLLERHELPVAAAPEVTLRALAALRLRDLPVVATLFTLRGLRYSPEATWSSFVTAPPFLALEEEPGRELVFGVATARPAPTSPEAFRVAAAAAGLAAVGTFRAEPREGGALLWTETWARTSGRTAAVLFGAYWLAIGPWSAWIRRILLRAARDRLR